MLLPLPQEQQSAVPAGKRDSVWTRRNAENAVQVWLGRVTLFREFDIPKLPIEAVCEKQVDVYCFGPTNGGVPFGNLHFVDPLEYTTSHMFVPKHARKQIDGSFRYMMTNLDAYLKKIPGDRWLNGQRIYHLIDHGEIERADKEARNCRAERWWCASLSAYTSYHLQQLKRADSLVAVALAGAPEAERCEWESIEDLIYGDPDRKWYMALSCEERSALAPTIWWLSDPLYMTPGNERRAAHYYREVAAQLFMDMVDAQPPYQATRIRRIPSKLSRELPTAGVGMKGDRDMWQSAALQGLLRSLGVPSFRSGTAMARSGVGEMILQYKQPTYHFVPAVAAMRNPLQSTAKAWNIEDPDADERYHPLFGSFTTLDHQLAWFRRGGQSQLIAAVDVRRNKLLGTDSVKKQLFTTEMFLTRSPADMRRFRDTIPGTRTTYSSRVPAESTIVSVEAMVAGIGAGRVRLASGPPPMPAQRVGLSDILLLDAPDALPSTLEAAAPRARPNSTALARSALGLFWEVYGLAAGDTVSYSLSATEGERSTVTRIGRFLGVVGQEVGSSITWTEHIATDSTPPARNIALDLSTLTNGTYTLQLDVRVPGQQPVFVKRDITIVRR